MQIQAQLKPHGSMEVELSITMTYNELTSMSIDLNNLKERYATSSATFNLTSLLEKVCMNVTKKATEQTEYDNT